MCPLVIDSKEGQNRFCLKMQKIGSTVVGYCWVYK